jgi:hypothetical protein
LFDDGDYSERCMVECLDCWSNGLATEHVRLQEVQDLND